MYSTVPQHMQDEPGPRICGAVHAYFLPRPGTGGGAVKVRLVGSPLELPPPLFLVPLQVPYSLVLYIAVMLQPGKVTSVTYLRLLT